MRRLHLLPLVAAGLACSVITGCGGAARTHRRRPRRPARSSEYAWLVHTRGPQPTIAVENSNAGTTAWRLPGPAQAVGGVARGTVSGYVAQEAVSPGQRETLYVSAPGSRTVRVAVFRIGWYGGAGGREMLLSRPLPLVAQPGCVHVLATGLTECRWHPTLSFSIPPALPSGVYIAKLSTATGVSDCLFVVLASTPQPLLAQLPTATYEAYNDWGGDSLYPGGASRVGVTGTTQGVEVSYDRPYDTVTGAGQFFARDVAMVRFLERYGYPVSYTTSSSVDEDPGQLARHRAVIDFGHSEYWSERQYDAFVHARDAGTSLLFFASDTLAWRIRFAPASQSGNAPGTPDHVIIGYKEHAALDPDQAQPSGPFPGGGAALTGSAYLGCITPRLYARGAPTYRYYSWQPNAALKPSWLFAGSGVTAATRIPGVVGYELDMRTAQTPPGTQLVGYGQAPCMSAAPGGPSPGPGQDLAETTLYTAASGAIVFNTGTLGWELGLEPVPSASPDAPTTPDPPIVAITRNLLALALTGPSRGR